MTEELINTYEGLFLFPQAQAGDLQAAVDHLREILAKTDATLISLRKWDERRLAYEIKGNKRGVYLLAYFAAPGPTLTAIERACNLSELLLRSLITRADHLTREQMEAADGRAELDDEIKLRAEETAKAQQREADSTASEETAEPVTVETETAPKDAAATMES